MNEIPTIISARTQFEQDLFLAPSGKTLYAEPRLMTKPRDLFEEESTLADRVSLDAIVACNTSFIIETRAEYGATTLCRRLSLEFAQKGIQALLKDARNLPNYRKKLELEFLSDIKSDDTNRVLIIDNFDIDRDERLLREVVQIGWFNRLICVSINRGLQPTKLVTPDNLPIKLDSLYLWPVSRAEIRSMAGTLFETLDQGFLSKVVDKVYSGLLGLCIPLSPSNVVMYLRVLHKEGEFHPLNRVDIVGRYLGEILRRPSDAYSDSFSSKNKIDFLSALVYSLYNDSFSVFNDRYWHDFCGKYQSDTLTDFDSNDLLHEFIECRIIVRWRTELFVRYQSFFNYFFGRHIVSHQEKMAQFILEEEYLRLPGVIDTITGLSSNNSSIVEHLTSKLNSKLEEFSEKYVRSEFDPLLSATWPDNEHEEEQLWEPVQKALETGPRDIAEIDQLKSSMLDEAKTEDQKVKFAKFAEMEISLFTISNLLGDALKNSDDVSGIVKLAAYDATLRGHLVAFQVGTMFASVLAQRRVFHWGGLVFIDFDKAAQSIGEEPKSAEAIIQVILSLCASVCSRAANDIGTHKLAPLFRERAKTCTEIGFLDLINFSCVITSRGKTWFDTATSIIHKADKNAYYLASMLNALMKQITHEIVQSKERDQLKRLVALIEAKRSFKKQVPGSKSVTKMLDHLERTDHFKNEVKDTD